MKLKYGEESNIYIGCVCWVSGLKRMMMWLIPMHLAEAAVRREQEAAETTPVVWGLDVARFGSDKTAFANAKEMSHENLSRLGGTRLDGSMWDNFK